jgi:hypothetical protein
MTPTFLSLSESPPRDKYMPRVSNPPLPFPYRRGSTSVPLYASDSPDVEAGVTGLEAQEPQKPPEEGAGEVDEEPDWKR